MEAACQLPPPADDNLPRDPFGAMLLQLVPALTVFTSRTMQHNLQQDCNFVFQEKRTFFDSFENLCLRASFL
eukprot:6386849-Amphidinium_carterae.1